MLTISQRLRIAKLGFAAECAVRDKSHLVSLAKYVVLPADYAALPNSVQACEDLGRLALREYLDPDRSSK